MERLLIVDDEWEAADYFERILLQEESLQLDVYKAHSAREALECLGKIRMDVVLSDIKMPGMDGLQMYDIIKAVSYTHLRIQCVIYAVYPVRNPVSLLGAAGYVLQQRLCGI